MLRREINTSLRVHLNDLTSSGSSATCSPSPVKHHHRTTATMRKVIVALALGYARGDGHNGAGTSESPCISPTGATRRPWKDR